MSFIKFKPGDRAIVSQAELFDNRFLLRTGTIQTVINEQAEVLLDDPGDHCKTQRFPLMSLERLPLHSHEQIHQ